MRIEIESDSIDYIRNVLSLAEVMKKGMDAEVDPKDTLRAIEWLFTSISDYCASDYMNDLYEDKNKLVACITQWANTIARENK